MHPFYAVVIPLGQSPEAGYPLPSPPLYPSQGLPGSPGHPDQGLPGSPGHPDQGLPGSGARPTPPIVIPPDAAGPGLPTHPIYLPGSPDNSLPGGSGGHPWLPGHGGAPRPTPPIVYPPGLPDQGLPPTPGLPPLVPSHPISGLPSAGQLPSIPPLLGGGGGTLPSRGDGLPEGSVLLIPIPTDANKPTPLPPGVATGSKPMLAWGGRGTLPIVVWIAPQATPK